MDSPTWISDANSDISSLELRSVEGQSLLDAFSGCKLGVSETLWLHLQFVFDNADICALATGKEIGDIANGGIERKVTKVDSVRWLVWKWELLTDGVTCALSVYTLAQL